MRSWQFEDLEFLVLWERLVGDALPEPFEFISSTPMYYDYLREKRQAAERLEDVLKGPFADVLDVLSAPDIRLVAHGWDPRNPDDRSGRIRILAARQRSVGFIVKQVVPGGNSAGGGFVVTECDPLRLADELVAALPLAAPGRVSEILLAPPHETQDDVDYRYGASAVGAESNDDLLRGSQRFLHRQLDLIGTIDVVQGQSKYGPRGISKHRLEWRDLPDDGRYAIVHAPPWKATSVDVKRLTSVINSRIAEGRAVESAGRQLDLRGAQERAGLHHRSAHLEL
ncbi:ESX secretion-associated protein EspG, partial [Nocardia sp. NPDC004722]